MKNVSFEVAKAIKDCGYPQYGRCNEYYNQEGRIVDKFCNLDKLIYPAPTYLEVWLWLWREKKIHIDVDNECCGDGCTSFDDTSFEEHNANDPEEAIIKTIKYLVKHKLIK